MSDEIFGIQDSINPNIKLTDWLLSKNWNLIKRDKF